MINLKKKIRILEKVDKYFQEHALFMINQTFDS